MFAVREERTSVSIIRFSFLLLLVVVVILMDADTATAAAQSTSFAAGAACGKKTSRNMSFRAATTMSRHASFTAKERPIVKLLSVNVKGILRYKKATAEELLRSG